MADTAVHPPLIFTRTPEYTYQLHQEMYQLQQSGSLTDFTLNVDGQSIPCHRLILASASPYFGAMFRCDMKECEKNEASLENLDVATANIIIEYMYTGNIACDFINAKDVMKAADFLQIPLVKEACEKYLVNQLNVNNCLGLFKVGKLFDLDNLVDEARALMHVAFNEVVQSDEFKELMLADLIEYIRDERYRIRNQDSLIDACIQWICADKLERQTYILDVLKQGNIQKCSYEFLNTMKTRYDYVMNKEFEQFIDGNILRRNMGNLQVSEEKKHIILFGDNGEVWSPYPHLSGINDNSWITLSHAPPKVSTKWYSVCQVNDVLITTGGLEARKQCHMFMPKYNTWTRLADMEVGCYYHSSESLGNSVYVIGGKNEDDDDFIGRNEHDHFISRLHVLNLDFNKWTAESATLHSPGILPITVTHGTKIYVILNTCNWNNEIRSKHGMDMQIYETVTDSWKSGGELPDFIMDSYGARAVSCKDGIYLVGGFDKLCVSYNVETETWTNLTPAPQIKNFAGVVRLGSTIRLYGGDCYNMVATDDVMEYDTERNKWRMSERRCKEKYLACFTFNMNVKDAQWLSARSNPTFFIYA